MNPLFAVAALGGLAALVFASDSSSSQKAPKRQPACQNMRSADIVWCRGEPRIPENEMHEEEMPSE